MKIMSPLVNKIYMNADLPKDFLYVTMITLPMVNETKKCNKYSKFPYTMSKSKILTTYTPCFACPNGTSLPTDQEVSGKIPGSVVNFSLVKNYTRYVLTGRFCVSIIRYS